MILNPESFKVKSKYSSKKDLTLILESVIILISNKRRNKMKNLTNTQHEKKLILKLRIAKENRADWIRSYRKSFGKYDKKMVAKYTRQVNDLKSEIKEYRKS